MHLHVQGHLYSFAGDSEISQFVFDPRKFLDKLDGVAIPTPKIVVIGCSGSRRVSLFLE